MLRSSASLRRFSSTATQLRSTAHVQSLLAKHFPDSPGADAAALAAEEAMEAAKNQSVAPNPRTAQINADSARHALFTWGPTNPETVANSIPIQTAKGSYFWDTNGKRYLDWNSQAMCVNFGHNNDFVTDAIIQQAKELSYVFPCAGHTEIRARLGALLADLCPGDINSFFFGCGGAEANEAAMRMARLYTGRSKVMSMYRGYHGGATFGAACLTGDPRRLMAEKAAGRVPGLVHFVGPAPYESGAQWSSVDQSLANLRETILCEGPESIACIFLEGVTGTNGVVPHPEGYLTGIRALCDEFGILMVTDEVMSGIGRCGALFGFQTSTEAVPDIITMAKGVSNSQLPFSVVGVSQALADHFASNPVSVGSTYNSHPMSLAASLASLEFCLRRDVISRSHAMGQVMASRLNMLKEKHEIVKDVRSVGMFGIVDMHSGQASQFNKPPTKEWTAVKKHMLDNGVWSMFKPNNIFCNPPLTTSEEDIHGAFDIIDEGITRATKA